MKTKKEQLLDEYNLLITKKKKTSTEAKELLITHNPGNEEYINSI